MSTDHMPVDHSAPHGCRICGNQTGNTLHTAREMFVGTRASFTYLACAACGTLQLRDVPDLGPYYANDYYSLQPINADEVVAQRGLKKQLTRRAGAYIRRSAVAYYCRRQTLFGRYRYALGKLLAARMPRVVVGFPDYLIDTQLDLQLSRKASILDVGSGAGLTLLALSHFGFRDLTGVDPFLAASITYPNGVRVLKAELTDLTRQFDLILANHSVEHVRDPRATLTEIHHRLKPGRFAIVRIPVVAEAWRRYGVNWVQLDPPRHLCLFPAQTFAALAAEAGFTVAEIRYDSTAFQFWGSEQYVRDIPLADARSYYVNPDNSIFTTTQLADFAAQAHELNAHAAGDQAVFYLRKH